MPEQSQCPSMLEVSVVAETPCLFVHLGGELDLCSVEDMPLDDYSSHPDLTTILVDLGDLTFCDGMGIRSLLEFREIHQAQGRSVVVVRANPFMERFMRILGIDDHLELERDAKILV